MNAEPHQVTLEFAVVMEVPDEVDALLYGEEIREVISARFPQAEVSYYQQLALPL